MNMKKLIIKTIEISNFRSIKNLKCDLSDISVFVGQNDAGKSNILKALNLFFNGEVEPGRALEFDEDFNCMAHRNKRANEIRIKVTFQLPDSYREKNGDFLIVEKRWRAEGEVPQDKIRNGFVGKREGKKEFFSIGGRSNVRKLISLINYIYVPAIRDANYFDILRLRIYEALKESASASLEKINTSFDKAVKKNLEDLIIRSKVVHKENISLSFPHDLSKIFEKLDFQFGENHISMERRGDGIKNKYIPSILEFIAQNMKKHPVPGAAPRTYIWAYEEPENNMEINNCIRLREQFINCVEMENNISQILITSHSPVFYNIVKQKKEAYKIFFIRKDEKGETNISPEKETIEKELGPIAEVSEQYQRLEKKLKRIEQEQQEARSLLDKSESCIFVEGSTDKRVLERIMPLFKIKPTIHIMANGRNGGHSYVIDMLHAWDLESKHCKNPRRAAGIVDDDAHEKAKSYNKSKGEGDKKGRNLTRCYILKPSKRVICLRKKDQFKVNVDLESFYPDEIWGKSKMEGWLEEKKPTEYVENECLVKCATGEKKLQELCSDLPLFVTHKVKDVHKGDMATMVCKLDDAALRKAFADLEPFLQGIANYLEGE